jgi:outer membrane protein OmpA-like peptidoglycan-associated protein
MLKLKQIVLGTVMAGALITPASAGTGWYLGLDAGWVHPENVTISGPGAGGGAGGQFHYADTYRINGSVGYKWDNGLRVQGVVTYGEARSKGFDPPPLGGPLVVGPGFTGNEPVWAVGGGLGYDIPIGPRWGIELGAGAGVSFLKSGGPIIVGNPTVFSWEGRAGVFFEATPNLDIDLYYAYSQISSSHFHNATMLPPNGITFASSNQQNIMLGFRYYLYHEPPPPPPYVPPPPPPPVVAPPVKTFIVFFDFDKSNLTAEAQSVVTEAVQAAKTNGWVKVMVTGHTDTVGSDTYNQALSERRAEAVKDEMVRQGMDASSITTQGKSFHDPLVPTGPGVREPQNRRAVIEY